MASILAPCPLSLGQPWIMWLNHLRALEQKLKNWVVAHYMKTIVTFILDYKFNEFNVFGNLMKSATQLRF